MLAVTFMVQPLRAPIDQNTKSQRRACCFCLFDPRLIQRPFVAMRADSELLFFTFAGLCFASAQGVLFAFFVAYSMEQGQLSLAAAGLAFSTMQLAGIVGRLTAGWVADRLRVPRLVLIGLAVGSALAVALTAFLDATWSSLQIHTVAALAGGTSTSWNGVFLSELSRLAPAGKIAEMTAAVTFFVFMGYVIGPALFGWAVVHGISYQTGFLLLTVGIIAGIAMLALTFIPKRASK